MNYKWMVEINSNRAKNEYKMNTQKDVLKIIGKSLKRIEIMENISITRLKK